MNQLRISLVIPVYNEERHLPACLEAIARQTTPPTEVIVVDNNSTDKSLQIARSYDFVRVISEPQQGRAFSRNTGFDAATGDIIARVDADVNMNSDWIERATKIFSQDPGLGAVTGPANAAMFFTGSWHGTFWSKVYFWVNDGYFRLPTLWGANMAVRREAWHEVAADLCSNDTLVHEDLDLSLALWAHDWPIIHDQKLIVATNGREYLQWPKLKSYTALRKLTKERNLKNGTLAKARRHRLPWWRAAVVTILMTVPAIIFIAASRILQTLHYPIQSGR